LLRPDRSFLTAVQMAQIMKARIEGIEPKLYPALEFADA
jgi:hypothetical protein